VLRRLREEAAGGAWGGVDVEEKMKVGSRIQDERLWIERLVAVSLISALIIEPYLGGLRLARGNASAPSVASMKL